MATALQLMLVEMQDMLMEYAADEKHVRLFRGMTCMMRNH